MVAPDINDLCPVFLHHLHDHLEEIGVYLLPSPGANPVDGPAVDDVAIHDELVAVDRLKELRHLCSP